MANTTISWLSIIFTLYLTYQSQTLVQVLAQYNASPNPIFNRFNWGNQPITILRRPSMGYGTRVPLNPGINPNLANNPLSNFFALPGPLPPALNNLMEFIGLEPTGAANNRLTPSNRARPGDRASSVFISPTPPAADRRATPGYVTFPSPLPHRDTSNNNEAENRQPPINRPSWSRVSTSTMTPAIILTPQSSPAGLRVDPLVDRPNLNNNSLPDPELGFE